MKGLRECLLIGLFLLLATSFWAFQEIGSIQQVGVLKNITLNKTQNQLEVRILLSPYTSHREIEYWDQNKLVFDLSDIKVIKARHLIEINDYGILAIRVGQYKPDVVRIVFDLTSETIPYRIEKIQDGLIVLFGKQGSPRVQAEEVKKKEIRPKVEKPVQAKEVKEREIIPKKEKPTPKTAKVEENIKTQPEEIFDANPHPTLISLENTKCLTCHDELIEGQHIHAPVEMEDCISCHQMKIEDKKTTVGFSASGERLCFTCHTEIEDILARENVHPALEEGCGLCHDHHASDFPKQLISSMEDLCAACHDTADEDFKNTHGRQPITSGGCPNCHDPHASDQEKLFVGKFTHVPFHEGECDACHKRPRGDQIRLRGEEGTLCYSCHSDKEKEFAKKGTHYPVKKGECTKCHSPHMAENKYQLYEEGKNLCLSCHDGVADVLRDGNIHPPAEESCFDCHSAHASDNILLLNEKVPDLCLMCHDAEEKVFLSTHYNQKGEGLNCTECHSPHGSKEEKLLNVYSHQPFKDMECEVCHENTQADKDIKIVEDGGSELCLACHDDKSEDSNKNKIKHSALEMGGCTSCHSPHASSWKFQLRDRTSRLCLTCHEEREKERNVEKFIHPIIDRIGCEACHDSHFSNNSNLLVEKPNELCLECHLQGRQGRALGNEVTILGKVKLLDSDLEAFKKIDLSSDLTRGHPQSGHIVTGYVSPDVINTRSRNEVSFTGDMTCLTCHDSHAGLSVFLFADNLTNGSEVCLKCHKK